MRLKRLKKDAGNVLFIILLCVALFAALAYAVTQSTRSGGGDASREQKVLQASQFIQYGTEIQTAIMRLKISNNCTEEQISFDSPNWSQYTWVNYNNPNSPVNYSCHVFRPEGGNVVWKTLPTNFSFERQTPGISGTTCVSEIGTGGLDQACASSGTTSDEDLVMVVETGVDDDLCTEVNKRGGISTSSIPIDNGCAWDAVTGFKGTFTETFSINSSPGKSFGCFSTVQCDWAHKNGVYFVLSPH